MFNKTKKWGFTLVEVLIVIIIVGILIAALLPRLTGSQDRARAVAAQQNANQVANGLGLLLTDWGSITTPAGLATTPALVCLDDVTEIANGAWDLSAFMTSVPAVNGTLTYGDSTACTAGEIGVYFFDDTSALVVVPMEDEGTANFVMPATTAAADTQAEVEALIAADAANTGDHFGIIVR